MTTLAVLLLFLLGAAAPTAAAAVAAPATATVTAPPAVTSPNYTNGELAERETERGHAVRRGPRHAVLLPPPDAPAAPDRAPAVRVPATNGPGVPPWTDDGRQQPSELSVLHCVFRC